MIMANRAVFFDRDGVINKEIGYLDSPDKVEIIPGVSEAISLLNKNKFKVVVITNQSGIARGYFTESTLNEINDFIKSELEKDHGKIDAVYYCPHHPDEGCDCRKPKIGMIEKAKEDLDIDLENSYLIGDKVTDVQTGVNAKLKSILLLTGYGREEKEKLKDSGIEVDYIAEDPLSAIEWILKESDV
jgi:D,D-heptose 1,7-bisphosphate phosphatase